MPSTYQSGYYGNALHIWYYDADTGHCIFDTSLPHGCNGGCQNCDGGWTPTTRFSDGIHPQTMERATFIGTEHRPSRPWLTRAVKERYPDA